MVGGYGLSTPLLYLSNQAGGKICVCFSPQFSNLAAMSFPMILHLQRKTNKSPYVDLLISKALRDFHAQRKNNNS